MAIMKSCENTQNKFLDPDWSSSVLIESYRNNEREHGQSLENLKTNINWECTIQAIFRILPKLHQTLGESNLKKKIKFHEKCKSLTVIVFITLLNYYMAEKSTSTLALICIAG